VNPRIRRAGHIVLRVTNVAQMKEFLERIVGFTTYGQGGREFYFLTSHPVTNHHMIAVRSGKPGERLPDAEHQIGMVSIAYEMADLTALRDLHQRMAAAAAAYRWRIVATEDRGSIYNLVSSDADGNRYEFWCTAPGNDEGRIDTVSLRGPVDLSSGSADRGERDAKALPPAPPSKLAIRRTSHLTLRCRDLEKTKEFYESALGLFVIAEDERRRQYLAGDPQSRRMVLALEPARDMNSPIPTPKIMYGMEHFSLEVGSFPELQTLYRRFKSLGVTIDHTQDHGVTASVYFNDPDGNLMEVYHDVPRAEIPVPEDPFASFGGIEERLEAS
jgi:catechol 2,3-dioxygenase